MSHGPVVLAAGGTGGHVFPAEALTRELMRRGHRLVFVTDRRGNAYSGALADVETYPVHAGGIAGAGFIGRLIQAVIRFINRWTSTKKHLQVIVERQKAIQATLEDQTDGTTR